MNVEIGTEAAQFPEKEYTKWDFRCSVVPVLSAFYFVLQPLVLGSWLLILDS
jgi:hypothetical protein